MFDDHTQTVAQTLEGVYRNFDPDWPLNPDSPWLIPVPRDPLTEILRKLRLSRGRSKLFFTGHRGSGKSTQLRRLVKQLAGDPRIIPFYLDAAELLDPTEVEYTDIILAMTQTLFRTWQAAPGADGYLPLGYAQEMSADLAQDLDRWGKTIVEEVLDVESASVEVEAGISAWIARAMSLLKRSHTSAKTLRQQIERDVDRLYGIFDAAVREIEAATGRQVLVIIDGLDRPSFSKAATLFQLYYDKLMQPTCHTLFVVGVALPYQVDRMDMEQRCHRIENLPVFADPIARDALDPAPESAACFYDALARARMTPTLLGEGARDRLVRLSAGVVWLMIAFTQRAAGFALDRGAAQIGVEDVRRVEEHLTYQFSMQLSRHGTLGDLALVQKACRDLMANPRLKPPPREVAALLDLQMVVEYPDGPRYLGVHPAMEPLIEATQEV